MHSPSPPSSLTRATTLFALGLALIVGLGLGAVLGFREVERATALRVHTYQVVDAIEDARAALLDVETGSRGFALSGTPEFLEPYQAGRTNLGPALATVRSRTVDNLNASILDLRQLSSRNCEQHWLNYGRLLAPLTPQIES